MTTRNTWIVQWNAYLDNQARRTRDEQARLTGPPRGGWFQRIFRR